MSLSKICSKCNQLKSLEEFNYYNKNKLLKESQCKKCSSQKSRIHREKMKNKLHIIIMSKICTRCNKLKSTNEFHKRYDIKCGLTSQCKNCRSSHMSEIYPNRKEHIYKTGRRYRQKFPDKHCAIQTKRRAVKLCRIPKWADLKAVETFYKNCPKGYEVDHIIPLQGKDASGLHVLNNLQYLTKSENSKKGNKFNTIEFNNLGNNKE
jgi:hypothetical protein